jgi:hypothetical protein
MRAGATPENCNEALDPWSPLVAYVGNRGDVIDLASKMHAHRRPCGRDGSLCRDLEWGKARGKNGAAGFVIA